MGKYNAGIITQEKIVNAAKHAFYENGYEKTTIKEICREAGVIRTVFIYYFPDKTAIADHISNYINEQIGRELLTELKSTDHEYDQLFISIYASMWFFYNILNDGHLTKFYAETLGNSSKILLGNRFYQKMFQEMYQYCGKNPESKEFELFFIYSTSSPGVFLNHYMLKSSDLTKEEIVEYLNRQVLNNLGVPKNRQDDIINEAFELISISSISFKDVFLAPYTIEE